MKCAPSLSMCLRFHRWIIYFFDADKQVFPQLELVGWYSTGSDIHPSDINIHKSIASINENPLYLLFDTEMHSTESKQLPVHIFESEVRLAGSDAAKADTSPANDAAAGGSKALQGSSLVFAKASYVIETVEAERIAVDQVAKIDTGSAQPNSVNRLASHLTGIHSAIKMLNARIKVIHGFLVDTKNGKVPTDHLLLQQIASVAHSLPAAQSREFREDFLREHTDTMLITYLATMTKGTSDLDSVIDKISLVYDKRQKVPM